MPSLYDPAGHRKYLNAAERARFLAEARAIPDLKRRSLCLTLFYTGCRISEALNLTYGNLDLTDQTLVFRTLKQRGKIRHRVIPVPPELVECLRAYTVQAGVNRSAGQLWRYARSTAWGYVKTCMRDAGLDGVKASPRGLRHGFAIAALAQNVPLPTIQRWLGHARLDTTAIYTQVVGDDERALAARLWDEMHTGV